MATLGQFYQGSYVPTITERRDNTLRDTLIAALVPELVQRTTRGLGTMFDDQPSGVGVAETGEVTPDFLSAFFGPSKEERLNEDLTRARIEEALLKANKLREPSKQEDRLTKLSPTQKETLARVQSGALDQDLATMESSVAAAQSAIPEQQAGFQEAAKRRKSLLALSQQLIDTIESPKRRREEAKFGLEQQQRQATLDKTLQAIELAGRPEDPKLEGLDLSQARALKQEDPRRYDLILDPETNRMVLTDLRAKNSVFVN